MNNQRRRTIRTVMRSLEANTNKIKYIRHNYAEQMNTLKSDNPDSEDDIQIKAIESKIVKLDIVIFDMEDVYETLEDVIAPK